MKVIKRLLEYGVELKSTSTVIQRIVINGSLIGYSRNKYVNVAHIFTKAIIKVLQKEVQIKPLEESKEAEVKEKTFKKLQILKSGINDGSEIKINLPLVLKNMVYGYGSTANLIAYNSPAFKEAVAQPLTDPTTK